MFVELTGYTSDEALGQNPGILKSGNIPEQVYVELWETILSGKVWRGNLHNRKKNGELYWESATIAPIFNDAGEIENFIAIKEDITDRKCAQDKVKKLLTEKELLLKEVHHRIKNNMNTIKGLISLQISAEENTSTIASLNDTESRVQSMIMLYDRLYCSENYRELSIRGYLHALTEEIINSFSNRVIVDIKLEIDDFILNVQTLSPLGIIVNELLTNIMKYAFTGRDRGVITLNASKKDNNVTVIIHDNGVGIPETVSFSKSTGFGLNLAYMLTEQIGGNIRIERGEGTKFVLEFKV
jgi:PAS domain S-box-containing protein